MITIQWTSVSDFFRIFSVEETIASGQLATNTLDFFLKGPLLLMLHDSPKQSFPGIGKRQIDKTKGDTAE